MPDGAGFRSYSVTFLVGLLALYGSPGAFSQGAGPQRAIEKLENCSTEERKQGCINILKRSESDNGTQAIKAQVRGGRIIWYQYDPETGKARRTN